MKMLSANISLIVAAALIFFGLYEAFPRPGWVDPGMYTGFVINPDLYNIYNIGVNTYQGSRLGYILPLHLFSKIFGFINGRLLYVLTLYLAYCWSILFLSGQFIKKEAERLLVCIFFLFNPIFISSILFGGADGPAAVQLVIAIAIFTAAMQDRSPSIKNLLYIFSGIFLALSLSSQVTVAIPALFILSGFFHIHKTRVHWEYFIIGAAFVSGVLLVVSLSDRKAVIMLALLIIVGALYIYRSKIRSDYLILGGASFLSGLFFALGDSHQLAVVISSLLISALLMLFVIIHMYKAKLSHFIFLALGAIYAVSILAMAGHSFGLEKFYPLYSLGFAQNTLKGTVSQFIQPFNVWIKESIFWIPVILFSLLSFFIKGGNSFREHRSSPLRFAAQLNLAGPIVFCIFYDVLNHGNMLGTPAYFNIFFPSFFVGTILLVALWTQSADDLASIKSSSIYSTKSVLVLLIFLNQVLAFSSEHMQPVFTYNSVHSRNLYLSQIAFEDRIASTGLGGSKIQLIYRSLNPADGYSPDKYRDYYMGAPRVFDYLDSMAGLFLWDLSIAARIEPNTDPSKIHLDLKNPSPLIVLGRDKSEAQHLVETLSASLGGYSSSDAQCYSDRDYPWCFITLKRDEYDDKNPF